MSRQTKPKQGNGLIRSGLSVQELKAITALRVNVAHELGEKPAPNKVPQSGVRSYQTANANQLVAAGMMIHSSSTSHVPQTMNHANENYSSNMHRHPLGSYPMNGQEQMMRHQSLAMDVPRKVSGGKMSEQYIQNFDVPIGKPDIYLSSQMPRSGMVTASTSGKSTPVTSINRPNDSLMPMKNYPASDNRVRHEQFNSQRFAPARDARFEGMGNPRLGNEYGQGSLMPYSERNDNFLSHSSKVKEAEIEAYRSQFADMSMQSSYSPVERDGTYGSPIKSSEMAPQRRVDYLSETLSASRARPVVPPLNAIASPSRKPLDRENELLGDYFGSNNAYPINSPSRGFNSFQSAGMSTVNGSTILPSLPNSPAARSNPNANKRFGQELDRGLLNGSSNQAPESEFMQLFNRPSTDDGTLGLQEQVSPSKYLSSLGMRNVGMSSLNTKLGSESNLMAFEIAESVLSGPSLSPDYNAGKRRLMDNIAMKTNQLSPMNLSSTPLSPSAVTIESLSSPGKMKKLQSLQTDYSSESISTLVGGLLPGKLERSPSMNKASQMQQSLLQPLQKLQITSHELSPRITDGWFVSATDSQVIHPESSPVGTNNSFPSPPFSQANKYLDPYAAYRARGHESDAGSDQSGEIEGGHEVDPATRSFTEEAQVHMSGVTLPFKYESSFYE